MILFDRRPEQFIAPLEQTIDRSLSFLPGRHPTTNTLTLNNFHHSGLPDMILNPKKINTTV